MDLIVHRFFNFQGRLNRQPYIHCMIVIWIASTVIGLMINSATSTLISLLFGIISLVIAASAISLGVRRLHDLDKSGWWLLIMFIPFVGFLFQLYMFFAKGTYGANTYGADPLAL